MSHTKTNVTLEVDKTPDGRMFNSLGPGEFFHLLDICDQVIESTVYKKIVLPTCKHAAIQVAGPKAGVSFLAQTQPVQHIREVQIHVRH